jgi:hypothetical protein
MAHESFDIWSFGALLYLLLGREAARRAAEMRYGGTTQASEFLEFLGSSSFEQHEMVLETEMGGISGLSYHAASDEWYGISDRSGKYWRFAINPDGWRVSATGVTQISGCGDDGQACSSLDAEGIATGCTDDDTLLPTPLLRAPAHITGPIRTA